MDVVEDIRKNGLFNYLKVFVFSYISNGNIGLYELSLNSVSK
jgi:hypothetical protein